MKDLIFMLLKGLELSGYLVIGFLLSTGASLLSLWAAGTLPAAETGGAGLQEPVGYAMGYGLVSTLIALPVWLVACLVPALRWRNAWWIALVLANGFMLVALTTDIMG
ncbi:hypothetical protein [Gymnodinialimonas sp.]